MKRRSFIRRASSIGILASFSVASSVGATESDGQTEFRKTPGRSTAPSENVETARVFPLPTTDPQGVDAGTHIAHEVFGIGGTYEAAEWWRDEVLETIEWTINEMTIDELSEYAEIIKEDELELVTGEVITDVWGLRVSYVTPPQSVGTYDFTMEAEYPSDSPERGEHLPIIEAGPVYHRGEYEVRPRTVNNR